MTNINVANHLLNLFQQYKINIIYGVTGDSVFPFFDVLSRNDSIKYIGTAHESGAAFMASYQAKLTGRIGVCIATSGPGLANLINGLADAYLDKAPVLAITGQVKSNMIGTGAKQYINQQKLVQEVTSNSELVTSGETAIPVVTRAIEVALSKKTVTHVSIPEDIFFQESNMSISHVINKFKPNREGLISGSVEEVLPILKGIKKPLIIVGLRDKNLGKLIKKFAEKLGAGIITSQQAKGIIPDSFNRVLGGIGQAYLPGILQETDCIIKIGSSSYEDSFLPEDINIIQITNDSAVVDYKKANYSIVGNVTDTIKSLLERLEYAKNKNWDDKINQEKDNLNNIINQQKNNNTGPIHPAYLMTTLSEVVPSDAIITCDIGGFAHWFDTFFQAKKHTVLISTHWRSMGSGLPGAIGVSLNQPEKKVITITGDGGLLMSLGELSTAVKYNIPVTVIVANNQMYELEKLKMEYKGLKPFGVDLHVPDFAALANSFGAEGKKVERAEDLEQVLRESIYKNNPVIVDVRLDQVPLPFIK